MKLYLDDDTASPLLAKLLRKAGHDVQIPSEVALRLPRQQHVLLRVPDLAANVPLGIAD